GAGTRAGRILARAEARWRTAVRRVDQGLYRHLGDPLVLPPPDARAEKCGRLSADAARTGFRVRAATGFAAVPVVEPRARLRPAGTLAPETAATAGPARGNPGQRGR